MKNWSYSTLTGFETCPKQYQEVRLLKRVKDDNEANKYGDLVHKAIAARLMQSTPFPTELTHLEDAIADYMGLEGQWLVEQQLAFRRDMSACEWFAKNTWGRAIIDFAALGAWEPDHAYLIDWKTGKPKEDLVQLYVMGTAMFIHYPAIKRVTAQLVWLKEGWATRVDFSRADLTRIWADLLPRIKRFDAAHVAGDFPAKPGFLCRNWCGVTSCAHHGK